MWQGSGHSSKVGGFLQSLTSRKTTLTPKSTYSQTCVKRSSLSDHMKQEICLVFQTDGCLLLYESSAESSCMKVVQKAHA